MPSFNTSRRVRHPADRMFDLVADVEKYPEFLPLCQALTVRRRKLLEDGRELVVADMRVGFKAIRETFTSRITLDKPALTILVDYVEGPFRSLENRWTFAPDPVSPDKNSTVSFFITYEFRSRMLGMLMGSMFDTAFKRFAEAFEQRANQVYGVA
jgi:coenzyme Q-binding protein COQ10